MKAGAKVARRSWKPPLDVHALTVATGYGPTSRLPVWMSSRDGSLVIKSWGGRRGLLRSEQTGWGACPRLVLPDPYGVRQPGPFRVLEEASTQHPTSRNFWTRRRRRADQRDRRINLMHPRRWV